VEEVSDTIKGEEKNKERSTVVILDTDTMKPEVFDLE